MTIAARVGCGRSVVSHGTNSSRATMASAPTTPVSWVLPAGRLGDRRPRGARADREAARQCRAQVRGAERDELLVLVDPLAAAQRERPRQDARVGQRDDGDGEAAGQHRQQVGDGRRPGWPARGRPCGRPRRRRRRPPRDPATAVTIVVTTAAAKIPRAPWPSHRAMTITARASDADPERGRDGRPAGDARRRSPRPRRCSPSPSTENPNSFGSWPMKTVRAMPLR